MKGREIERCNNNKKIKSKNKMQYLQASRENFVSVIGLSLLLSFSICLWCFHSSWSYCLTLGSKKKKKKSLLLTLNLPTGFCWSSQMLHWGSGLHFFFLSCGSAFGAKSGLQYSQASSVQPKHSELCAALTIYMGQASAFNPPHCATI